MSSKRQAPGPSPAASEGAKKPRGASPAPIVSIDSLPRHLLTEIFFFAPPAARLQAIALVCKRWRTAALHACDTLFAEDELAASALARFPCLTSLAINCEAPSFVLPTSLRKLALSSPYLYPTMAAAQRGVCTFFAQEFPNLTKLRLEYRPLQEDEEVAPLLRLLKSHASRIVSLNLCFEGGGVPDPLIGELAKLSLPSLTHFSASDLSTVSLVEALPQLKKLKVRLSAPDFMACPDRLLTALCVLDTPNVTADLLTRLRKFSHVRALTCSVGESLWHHHQDLLSRVVTKAVLDTDWDVLRRSPNLRALYVRPDAAPPTPIPLPRLKRVVILLGDMDSGQLAASSALQLALGILRSQPHIQSLYVTSREPGDLREEEATQRAAEELVAAAVTQNLRVLILDGAKLPSLFALPAVKYGWLRLFTA